jgi:PIN domain nuclease of toxin-antitoxin system
VSLYLADAPALAGFYTGAPDFPHAVRSILEERTGQVGVLATTLFRLASLTAQGRLPVLGGDDDAGLGAMLQAQGFALLPLDAATAEQAAHLPPLHADPWDRLLVATAQRTGRVVLTDRAAVCAYGVPCAWAGD